MAEEIKIPIPARLYNAAVGGHVAGAEDIYAGNNATLADVITDFESRIAALEAAINNS